MFARLAAVLALFFVTPAFAQVYKCTDKSGKAAFQDSPCDGSIPRPAAPPPPAQGGAKGSLDSLERLPPQDSEMALLMFFYAHCTRVFPDLHAKTAMNYQAWRLKNSQAVSRIEGSAEFQAMVKRGQEEAAANLQKPGARDQAHGQCAEMLTAAFEPPPANVAKTPQEAWNGFMSAVAAGDVPKALGYLSPGSRGRYREVLNSLGTDGMRNASAKFGELKSEMRVGGDLAFGYLLRPMPDGTKQAFEISFMRDRRTGGWLIESM